MPRYVGIELILSVFRYLVYGTWFGNFVSLDYYRHNVDMPWVMLINQILFKMMSIVLISVNF